MRCKRSRVSSRGSSHSASLDETSCGEGATPFVVIIDVVEEPLTSLSDYAAVPIAFDVTEVLALDPVRPSVTWADIAVRRLAVPCRKDYDAIAGNHPVNWPPLALFGAYVDGVRVGGAAWRIVASPGPDTAPVANDAELWDLRVVPTCRGMGIGSALLRIVERAARASGATVLHVETQDINVPACRFYAARGFVLASVNRGAYPELPTETQLVWVKSLLRGADPLFYSINQRAIASSSLTGATGA